MTSSVRSGRTRILSPMRVLTSLAVGLVGGLTVALLGPPAVTLVILSVVAVALSWTLVNTVFALKYARLYYLDEDGGIDFKQSQPPAYSDFAYMAFTVGMTYGVTETEPNNTHIRKLVLGHALMSYAFGAGILAVAINLVTNLG
jgi:uncharacterized membrane protein